MEVDEKRLADDQYKRGEEFLLYEIAMLAAAHDKVVTFVPTGDWFEHDFECDLFFEAFLTHLYCLTHFLVTSTLTLPEKIDETTQPIHIDDYKLGIDGDGDYVIFSRFDTMGVGVVPVEPPVPFPSDGLITISGLALCALLEFHLFRLSVHRAEFPHIDKKDAPLYMDWVMANMLKIFPNRRWLREDYTNVMTEEGDRKSVV